MAAHEAKCAACGRAFTAYDAAPRLHCSVGCQFGGVALEAFLAATGELDDVRAMAAEKQRAMLADLTALGEEIGEPAATYCAAHDAHLPCRKCDREAAK